MSSHEEPLAIPERAGESTRVNVPDDSGTTVTLEEAAAGWKVSLSTLRRRLNDGELDGAVKRPSPKGDRWAIPVASLAKYKRRDAEPEQAPQASAQESEIVLALLHQLNGRQLELEAAHHERVAEQVELRQALISEAEARTKLESVQAELERVRSELEEARALPRRRGLFRRGK